MRALCARFSTTAAAGFVPDVGNFCFAFCFSSARLFFFSIYSLRFALLRSSLVTDFRIFNFAVMVMERERERERGNFHGDVRMDFGRLEESLG